MAAGPKKTMIAADHSAEATKAAAIDVKTSSFQRIET
jgi:hypothetical protein